MASIEGATSANHQLPIAAGSGSFSSSFLRRQRKDTLTSISSSLSNSTSSGAIPSDHLHGLPPPLIPDTDLPTRSIVSASSSPVRRKPLPANASPVILSRLSRGSSISSSVPSPPPTRRPPSLLPQTPPSSKPNAADLPGRQSLESSSRHLETVDEVLPFVPRDLDR